MIKTTDLMALSNMFSAISSFSAGTASAVRNVAEAIREIVSAMGDLPMEKTMAFTSTFRTLTATPVSQSVNAQNTGRMIHKASSFAAEMGATSPGNSQSPAVVAQNNFPTSLRRPIIIELDGKVIKRMIIDVLNDEMNPRRV